HHGELVGNLVDEAPMLAQEPAVDLARQVQDGRRRHASLELGTHGVRRSRTGRGQAHTEPTGRPREPVGRTHGTLLVTGADRADPAITPDRVVDGEVVDTRDAEDDIDPRPREHVHDHVAACPICHLAPVLRFVSAGITGRRYTPQVASLRWMIASRLPTSVSSTRRTYISIRRSKASVRLLHTWPSSFGKPRSPRSTHSSICAWSGASPSS